MTNIDPVAAYGAILATLLALVQYKQWRATQAVLSFKVYEKASSFPAPIDATITNVASHVLYLEFVGIGYSYRPYLTPWRTSFLGIRSMKVSENGMLSGKGAEGPLEPGKTMEVYFDLGDFERLERPTRRNGFGIRLCAWIDHSRSDQTFRKAIA